MVKNINHLWQTYGSQDNYDEITYCSSTSPYPSTYIYSDGGQLLQNPQGSPMYCLERCWNCIFKQTWASKQTLKSRRGFFFKALGQPI